jgi:hypothetical protein
MSARDSEGPFEAALLESLEPLLQTFIAEHDGLFAESVAAGLKALDEHLANIPVITPDVRQRIIAKFRQRMGGPAEAKGLH